MLSLHSDNDGNEEVTTSKLNQYSSKWLVDTYM